MQAVPVNQFPLVDGLPFIRDQEWMPCFLERSVWDVLPLLILPDRRCAGPAPSVELQREDDLSNIDRFYILFPNLAPETELRRSAV